MLAPVSDDRPLGLVGAFTGFWAGSICGPFLGAVTLYREIKAGRCTESAEIIGTTVILLGTVVVCGGFATLCAINVVRTLP